MIIDMKNWLENAPGRAFTAARAELGQAGYIQVKSVRNRANGNTVVSFRKAERGEEASATLELEHDWEYDHYGIGKAGSVVRTSYVLGGNRYDYS